MIDLSISVILSELKETMEHSTYPFGDGKPICEVCRSTVDLIMFDCGGIGRCIVPVCRQCLSNGCFNAWLESQMELALALHPNLEPIGEGLWNRKW